jgi:hypothetical protein
MSIEHDLLLRQFADSIECNMCICQILRSSFLSDNRVHQVIATRMYECLEIRQRVIRIIKYSVSRLADTCTCPVSRKRQLA